MSEKLNFPVTPQIREELAKASVRYPWKTIDVHEDSYKHLKKLIDDGGYVHLSEEERHAIAVGCCFTHPDHKDKHLEPLRHPVKRASLLWATYFQDSIEWKSFSRIGFGILVVVLLILIVSTAHCQTSQIDVVTFKNAANTTVKSYAAPFTIKEGTGVTFSAVGSVMTINSAGAGGTFYQTFQSAAVSLTQRATANFFGAIVCVDNAGSTRTDCSLALNNAVANQYLTGVDASGNFIRASIPVTSVFGRTGAVVATNADYSASQVTNAVDKTAANTYSGGGLQDLSAMKLKPPTSTVASLPAAASNTSVVYEVTDGSSSSDCTTGSGTTRVWCVSTGSVWVAIGDGGAGGSGASTADTFITVAHDADLTAERILACTSGDLICTDGGANNAFTLDTGANIPKTTTSNTYSAGTSQNMDTITAKYWGGAPVFDVSKFAGADWCAKVLAVYSDAAFIATSRAILDARGLTGSQTCAAGGTTVLSPNKPTHWILGQMTLSLPTAGVSFLQMINTVPSLAAPTAPTLSTATTGGSLAAATTYGVKITLVNMIGETLPSTEATKLTGAGATNSITVPTPTVGTGGTVQAYNVYSATPIGSGWKLNNVSGPIPIGTNYVIQTVGAGAIPPTTGTAWEGMFEFEGQGDSTIISEDSANSPLLFYTSNTYIHGLKFVSTQTTNNTASMWMNGNDMWADHITFAGGGTGIAVLGPGANRIHVSNIHYGKPTIAGMAILTQNAPTDVTIDGVTVDNSIWPTATGTFAGIYIQNTIGFRVSNTFFHNLDLSTVTNGAGLFIDNSSYGVVDNPNCNFLLNADCWTAANLSHDITVNNEVAHNMNVGTPLGTHANNGDCFDVFTAGQITINNPDCDTDAAQGGFFPPLGEIYNSQTVKINGGNLHNGIAEGISSFGTEGLSLNGLDISLNAHTGLLMQDYSANVSCNGGTTITFVSGEPFGPWNIGTPFKIAGNSFTIAAVPTSTNTLTANTTCTTGNPLAMVMSSTDAIGANLNIDTNGRDGLNVACTDDGICISGSVHLSLINLSANDNQTTKHQVVGIRVNSATARVTCEQCNLTGNLTAPYIDTGGLSYFDLDDGTTPVHVVTAQNKLGQADIVADSGAINTTETIIIKTPALPANRLIAGTHVRMTLTGTCTTTVANTSTFTLRMGTNGTTADTAIATPVTSVAGTTGTNIPFKTVIDFTVRTVGSSATGTVLFALDSNGLTGIVASQTPQLVFPSMSTFNTTTANNILSISYKSAATTTTSTFKNATIEIVQN